MVEKLRSSNVRDWLRDLSSVLLLILVASGIVFGAGGSKSKHDENETHLQSQIDNLSSQVSRLADILDKGPRMDQLQRTLDAYDTRMRNVETQESAMAARLEGIDMASRAQLGVKQK